MPDLSLLFCFEHGFVHAGPVAWLVDLPGTMELINIDMIGLQQFERGLELFPELSGGFCHCFCGQKVCVPIVFFQRFAYFFLAVRVGAGGVEKAHAAIICFAQQRNSLFFGNALDGQGAESVLHGLDARAS